MGVAVEVAVVCVVTVKVFVGVKTCDTVGLGEFAGVFVGVKLGPVVKVAVAVIVLDCVQV